MSQTRRLFWLLGLLALLSSPAESASPRFDLVPLGVLGGEIESNSSCFLLRHHAAVRPSMMIDCGSPVDGIVRWEGLQQTGATVQGRMKRVQSVLADVGAILLTHSHLDHLYGLLLSSPIRMDGVLKGRTTDVWGTPATIAVLEEHLFGGKVWGDFTKVPSPEHPVLRYQQIREGERQAIAGFQVEAIRLNHPVPASAYLITTGDASYLHLGDTGPSDEVWAKARPLLRDKRLKAVAIETSFGSGLSSLALRTGHLTPVTLVGELAKLSGESAARPPAAGGAISSMEQARGLAAKIAPSLEGVRIFIHHVKPSSFDDVERELETLKAAGLPLEVLQQGKPVEF